MGLLKHHLAAEDFLEKKVLLWHLASRTKSGHWAFSRAGLGVLTAILGCRPFLFSYRKFKLIYNDREQTSIRLGKGAGERQGGKAREHRGAEETCGMQLCSLSQWVAVSRGIPTSKLIKLSTLNVHSSLYVSNTSIELFKSFSSQTFNSDIIVIHM